MRGPIGGAEARRFAELGPVGAGGVDVQASAAVGRTSWRLDVQIALPALF